MTTRSILVIDDDVYLSRLIELSLAQVSGLVCRRASNGVHGAQLAQTDPPDLILLDFEMPQMDGLDTLQRLRASERTARTPIVAITGSQHNTPRCAEMIAACDAYVPKPFALGALRKAVLSLLSPGEAPA